MKKRFIEWDLPLAEISEASANEKNIRHGHPSTLHVWWARRPLASSRVTNFTALIDVPDDKSKRKQITELIKNISSWESVKNGNDKNIKKSQEIIKENWGDNKPKVLDPFSGGGSIPLEALRLGCDTYINDYNPVAVLIEKATIEWPHKFGFLIPHPDKSSGIDGEVEKINFLSYMVEKWTNKILNQVKHEIGNFYLSKDDGSIPVGYLWARTIPCQNPNCGIEIPLVRQFWLSKKSNKKIAYKPIINKSNKTIDFEILKDNMGDFNPSEGTISRGNAICPFCGQVTEVKKVRKLAQNGKMGERLVVNIYRHHNKVGKTYTISTDKDFKIFKEIEKLLKDKQENWKWLEKPVPDEELPLMSGVFNVPLYGIDNWGKLFNPRQKLSLITFLEKIKSSYKEILSECKQINIEKNGKNPEEAAKAIMGFLGIVLDMHAAFNNRNARWENTSEAIKHLFGRQALGMMWDYVEVSPFSGSSGTPTSGLEYYKKNIEFTSNDALTGRIFMTNTSATSLPYSNDFFDAIFTDPPYYNNVPYADLSDFFYVWLKRSVGDLFPEMFSTPLAPKSKEICEMAGWDSKRYSNKDQAFFETELSNSFKEIYRVLKPEGIVTIVYAHKTTKGWETVLNSLINAGLVVTASWPIHTEMKVRLRAASSAALASSIYLVCRKKGRKKVGFYSEIQPLIKEKVETKLKQFWDEGIVGGDFFISSIGPGMEIYSQYEKIEKFSGEKVTTVELLDYIRTVSTDFIVGKLLKDASSAIIDNESEFYLAYRWTYQDNTVEYDDARKLSNASGVNLEKLWNTNSFVEKSGSKIRILGPKERNKFESSQNMVDVMHKSLLFWENGDRENISKLLAETGYGKDPAFKQFCQAIAESLLNGNKEKQLLEGFLIGIDAYTRGKAKAPKDQTDLKQFGGS